MPNPDLKGTMVPIFYFLNGTHTEDAFKKCIGAFIDDATLLKKSVTALSNCVISPYQVITDMSLVIFKPCLRKNDISYIVLAACIFTLAVFCLASFHCKFKCLRLHC